MSRSEPGLSVVRRVLLALLATLVVSVAWAQQCTYELEPNDTPAQATLITGEGPNAVGAAARGALGAACFAGVLSSGDQDAFLWVVDETAAAHSWRVEIEGPWGGLTKLDIFDVEFAENGTDVLRADTLFTFATRDGSLARSESFLIGPGRYVIGMSQAGVSGEYVVNLWPEPLSRGRSEYREGRSHSGEFNVFGSLEDGLQVPFTVPQERSGFVWALDFQAPLCTAPTLVIEGQGGVVTTVGGSGATTTRVSNLGLAAGDYTARVEPSTQGEAGPVWFGLQAMGRATDGVEIEPNDRMEDASWLPLGGEVRAVAEGTDFFVIEVPAHASGSEGAEGAAETSPVAGGAGGTWDLNLESTRELHLQLMWPDRQVLQERRGVQGSMRGLQLAPGTYYLMVRGDGDAPYTLSLTPSPPPEEGFEREPNDRVAIASPLGPGDQVRGELWAQDVDFFRLEVEGEAQRYRLQAVGRGVEELELYDAGGARLARVTGSGRLRLDDVVLLPGANYVRVRGSDGEYALRALSLGAAPEAAPHADAPAKDEPLAAAPSSSMVGDQTAEQALQAPSEAALPALPPPPPGVLEIEPNDDRSRAMRLMPGVVHVGRLSTAADEDIYRFNLDVEQYVRVEVVPPEGESGWAFLLDGTTYRALGATDDSTVVAETWLLAGDHNVVLRGSWNDGGSTDYYQLRLTPLGTLGLPVDREPNDTVETAAKLPADLSWSGRVGEARDRDLYALPVFSADTTLTLEATANEAVWFDVLTSGDGRFAAAEDGAQTVVLPAGEQTHLRVGGEGVYDVRLAFSSQPDPAYLLPPRAAGELEIALELDQEQAAAFWHEGQRISGTLAVTNRGESSVTADLRAASDHAGVRVELASDVTVPAAGSVSVPVTVELPDDVSDQAPVNVQVAASGGASLALTGYDLALRCEAPPVGPFRYTAIPSGLIGLPNALYAGFGAAVPEGIEASVRDRYVNDGRTTVSNGGWAGDSHSPTFRLAGDDPVTLVGTILNPASDGPADRSLRTFRVETSLDGVTFLPVFEGRLTSAKVDQAYVFDEPVEARFARLVALDSHRGQVEGYFGEWKLIASDPTLASGLDLTDPLVGGHVVWSRPPLGDRAIESLLTGAGGAATVDLNVADDFTFVVGFEGTRAAKVASLSLTQPEDDPEMSFDEVQIAVSLTGAAGPWQPLAHSALDGPGSTTTIELQAPAWARYLKFTFPKRDGQRHYYAPRPISVLEAPAEDGYLSILAEWGTDTTRGPYEYLEGPSEAPLVDGEDAGDSAAQATPLVSGEAVTGTVSVAEDVDWFRVNVPPGENHLEVRLSGDPAIAYVYELTAEDGSALPVSVTEDGHEVVLSAFVDPGDYLLRLEEPKRTVVFAWDTSGSVSPYQPITYSSLASFARDVDGDREAVQLMAFDEPFPQWLLPLWSSDPLRVQRAISGWDREADSSNAELALLSATRALRDRDGTKAVLFMTDAESPGRGLTAELWEELEIVRPRVFTFEISSGGNRYPQQLMQSWAAVNGGVYQMSSGVGDFDAGFARASCLLRRPKRYTVEVTTSAAPLPGPGTLSVMPAQEAGAPGVHVIFDASGSMGQVLPSGEPRIAAAKRALDDLVGSALEEGTPFSLRAFGHVAPNSCETSLDVPLGPLDREAAQAAVARIEPKLLSQTAIADSLLLAADDLASASGPRTVILITDGAESCGGDPAAAAAELRAAGDTVFAIVSLALDPEGLAVFESLAEEIGATYVDVGSFEGLSAALVAALNPAFEVYDQAGDLVASGRVGESVELPMGLYRVRVLTGPEQVFEDVLVPGDGSVRVTVGGR